VWVSQPGPISGVIGVDANNLAAVTGTGTVVYCQSTIGTPVGSPSGGDLTITTSNGSSTGKYVSTSGTGQFVPATTGQTGAEAGNLTACSPTTGGSCTQGTSVKVDNIGVTLANKTGVDDNTTFPVVTQGTTSAQNIACVGTTCARSVKVSAGSVAVYVDRDPAFGPTANVPLCVSVGPGLGCP
jgi:hypothetical protein